MLYRISIVLFALIFVLANIYADLSVGPAGLTGITFENELTNTDIESQVQLDRTVAFSESNTTPGLKRYLLD